MDKLNVFEAKGDAKSRQAEAGMTPSDDAAPTRGPAYRL